MDLRKIFLGGVVALAGALGAGAILLFAGDSGRSDEVRDPSANDAGAVGEGISVHGDWVIEVRNPDGSIAERREFENALSGFGANFLAKLLDRTASTGAWAVELLTPC